MLGGGYAVLFHDRIPTLARLASGRTGEDVRFQVLPTLFRMVRDNLPFGSGFGSFEHVFRVYEPDSALASTYLNQANNDLLQPVIEGGLPAVALMIVLARAYLRRWLAALHTQTQTRDAQGRIGQSVRIRARSSSQRKRRTG